MEFESLGTGASGGGVVYAVLKIAEVIKSKFSKNGKNEPISEMEVKYMISNQHNECMEKVTTAINDRFDRLDTKLDIYFKGGS